jgi:hypothetical protein
VSFTRGKRLRRLNEAAQAIGIFVDVHGGTS